MSNLELYRERREALLKDAAASPLVNVRDRLEKAAAAFGALLEREEIQDANRQRDRKRRADEGRC